MTQKHLLSCFEDQRELSGWEIPMRVESLLIGHKMGNTEVMGEACRGALRLYGLYDLVDKTAIEPHCSRVIRP